MILIDTSIWVDYFIRGDGLLDELLNHERVLIHPFVIGEIAIGNLQSRSTILEMLRDLPTFEIAADYDVLTFVARENLGGTALSYIDAHLLAAAQNVRGATIWTRDKRLHAVALRAGFTMDVESRLH